TWPAGSGTRGALSNNVRLRSASIDPSLSATIVERRPLAYRAKASPGLDRPPHVRAGSSITWVGRRLGLVQDDANFVALVDPRTGLARSITLPAGEEGKRHFDDLRGNKKHKLDLEACCTIEGPMGTMLLALGSGSRKRRRRIVTIESVAARRPRVSLIDAESLYVALGRVPHFAGSDMNIEGALGLPGALRLFTRGNGAAKDGRLPVNATGDLDLHALLAYLASPEAATIPALHGVTQYELGTLDALPLGFTDAAMAGSTLLYTAAAEASKDASDDGRVSGSVIGIIPAKGALRYAPITDERGRGTTDKVEGIVALPGRTDRVLVVVDPDDPTRPSELCDVSLGGDWG
ncbi:MAG: hypothetical protein KA761_11865, partial [Gemmatimonadaceae bacterium]|nr:hypothetical protein [Gemmatimonadaceae bacterium]